MGNGNLLVLCFFKDFMILFSFYRKVVPCKRFSILQNNMDNRLDGYWNAGKVSPIVEKPVDKPVPKTQAEKDKQELEEFEGSSSLHY